MTAHAQSKILLSPGDLLRLGINFSPSTLRRWEAAGKFPKRIYVGDHSIAWMASEIHAHISQLAASRAIGQ